MMANPRKFSEKIALHNQKQAEETAAFEQIMREVIGATRQESSYSKGQHHLHISQNVGAYRAGSLPNVNQISSDGDKSAIDLQAALNNLEEIKQGQDQFKDRRHFDHRRINCSPYSATYLSPPPDTNWRRTNSDSALHQSSMISNQHFDNFAVNTSPRRSTFHNVDTNMIIDDGNMIESWDPGKNGKIFLSASLPDDSRPKSCEVPGIAIYPTQEDPNTTHHHIPISTNTGSLPDLTNLHFPAPLSTPIDIDDSTGTIQPASPYNAMPGSPHDGAVFYNTGPGSPYSPQSPTNATNYSSSAPMTIHNTSAGVMMQQQSGQHGCVIGNGIINNPVANHRQSSPGPSPSPTSSRRRPHHHLNNLVIGNPRHHHAGSPMSPQQQQQQQQQGLAIDTSALSIDGNAQYSTSPTAQNLGYSSSQQYQNNSINQGQNYVPPQSPLQQQMSMGLHRSTTPSDHSCSAPTSPVSHHISPICSPGLPSNNLSKSPFTDNSYFNVQQTNLQHQLEQIKMVGDFQSESSEHLLMMPGNGVHSSSSSASSSTGGLYMSGNQITPRGSLSDQVIVTSTCDYSPLSSQSFSQTGIIENQQQAATSVYYTSNQGSRSTLIQSPTLAYSKSVISNSSYQQSASSNQPQTPQTPTSIPDIILTGPNVDEGLLRGQDFAKDIGTAMASMSGSFDASELFPSDEALRAGLDPIDFDGLQILPDIDNSNDESFRLERS